MVLHLNTFSDYCHIPLYPAIRDPFGILIVPRATQAFSSLPCVCLPSSNKCFEKKQQQKNAINTTFSPFSLYPIENAA